MPVTQFNSDNIGEVRRNDIDVATSGQALITKIIAGTNISISSTGVDAGTGDVTINASLSGGGITRVVTTISSNTTAGANSSTDYVYFCTGSFTFTFPTAVGNTNRYTIKNIGTGFITLATTSSQLIEGVSVSSNDPIRSGTSLDFVSDGTGWYII